MQLTREERDLLEGRQGSTLQKIMTTLVLYGEALEAERFVDIEGDGHFSISSPGPGTSLPLEILDELVGAGLKTRFPFTLDPRAPLDFKNLGLSAEQEQEFREMFRDVPRYHKGMTKLGLRDPNAYTCSPYLPEAGNTPRRDAILAWSESSCVIYANSVLAARTNRNAAILDIFSNIVGKTPLFGLLADEGRRATWRIEVRTRDLPNPQLLGGAIGSRVQEDVPYITGLAAFLGRGLNDRSTDYLKEMGAACAALGAVGLFHVEGITPEAVEQGPGLVAPDHRSHVIFDEELDRLMDSYPVMWADKDAAPRKCVIGCPHLSLRELHGWTDSLSKRLEATGRSKIAVETVLMAPPQVLQEFKTDKEAYHRLMSMGARLSATCCEDYMNNRLCGQEAVVTNSNKLRAFTSARMFVDDKLVEVIVTGQPPPGGTK